MVDLYKICLQVGGERGAHKPCRRVMRLSEVTVSAVTPKAVAFFEISSISGFSLQQHHNCLSEKYFGQVLYQFSETAHCIRG